MFRKIQTKLAVVYSLAIIIVSIAAIYFTSIEIENYLLNKTKERLHQEVDVIAVYLNRISELDIIKIDSDIKSIAKKSESRITLIEESGRVILDSEVPLQNVGLLENHSNRTEIIEADHSGIGTDKRKSKSLNVDYFYLAKKVHLDAKGNLQDLKYIRTSKSLYHFEKTINEVKFNIVITGLIFILVIISISVLVSQQISKPLKTIVTDLKEIHDGNFNKRLQVKTKDEIKLVAEAVNELVQKIQEDLLELDKLSKIRSQFLANVSHEIRTPIFSVQAFLETLMEGAIDDPEVNRDYLKKAHEQLKRLDSLLQDLIDISRIESGEMKLSFRYFDLHPFLKTIVDESKFFAEQREIKLTIASIEEVKIQVFGDKEKLSIAINNLIDNAIRYNPPGTEVKVYFKKENNLIRIFIEDNGIGIAEEHLQRIFERFYRIDKERSRELGGTGLGLAIVKHIIEAHDSNIKVQSTLNKGSVFSFTLKT